MALAFIPLQAHAKEVRTLVVKDNGSTGKRILVVFSNDNPQDSGSVPKHASTTQDAENIGSTNCEEVYFAPDDHNHEYPLQVPHPEFMKSYKRAKAGNVIEQRNVAVSYDAGYLVSACPEKAHYWYQKAAQNNDQIAQDWLARHNKFKAIHDGPEFMIAGSIKPQALAKVANQNIAATPSSASQDTGKGVTYKCANVLDGSDYVSSKPCPKMLGRSLVGD
jgi:TPR repeat protein